MDPNTDRELIRAFVADFDENRADLTHGDPGRVKAARRHNTLYRVIANLIGVDTLRAALQPMSADETKAQAVAKAESDRVAAEKAAAEQAARDNQNSVLKNPMGEGLF